MHAAYMSVVYIIIEYTCAVLCYAACVCIYIRINRYVGSPQKFDSDKTLKRTHDCTKLLVQCTAFPAIASVHMTALNY